MLLKSVFLKFCIILMYTNDGYCVSRAKSTRRPGGSGSHVYVLPARQFAVARTESRYVEGTLPEDWRHQAINAN